LNSAKDQGYILYLFSLDFFFTCKNLTFCIPATDSMPKAKNHTSNPISSNIAISELELAPIINAGMAKMMC
jgi:hypothetical protein